MAARTSIEPLWIHCFCALGVFEVFELRDPRLRAWVAAQNTTSG